MMAGSLLHGPLLPPANCLPRCRRPACSGDKALKLGSDRTLPCATWQLAAATPSGPSKNLVGVPVTIKSTCRMAPNPACNASLTGPTICTDGYTNMGAGGQWVIEAVGSASPQRYRLRSLVRMGWPWLRGYERVRQAHGCERVELLSFCG